MPTRHRAQKHTYLNLEYEKSENQVPYISDLKKQFKDAHRNSVQNGCDTFPNELVWFHFEAEPIWKKIKNTVKCNHLLNLALTCYVGNNLKMVIFENGPLPPSHHPGSAPWT